MGENQEDLFLKRDKDGDTILHIAVVSEHVETVEAIIQNKKCSEILDVQNHEGQTALHLAVAIGNHDVTVLLLRAGANPSLQDNKGDTALHVAVNLGKNQCLQLIIHESIDSLEFIDMKNENGSTALHCAVDAGNNDAVKFLLEKQADVNCTNKISGFTALHYATQKGSQNAVQIILDYRPDVNLQSADGSTPLHYVTHKDKRPIAKLLLDEGADIYVKNKNGESPHSLSDKTMQRYLQRNRLDRKTRRSRASKDTKQDPEDQIEEYESNASGSKVSATNSAESLSKKRKFADSNNALSSDASGNAFQPDLFGKFLDSDMNEFEIERLTLPMMSNVPNHVTQSNYVMESCAAINSQSQMQPVVLTNTPNRPSSYNNSAYSIQGDSRVTADSITGSMSPGTNNELITTAITTALLNTSLWSPALDSHNSLNPMPDQSTLGYIPYNVGNPVAMQNFQLNASDMNLPQFSELEEIPKIIP